VETRLAKTARAHAKANITGGKEPRPDDIAKALYPMLEVNTNLRAHQDNGTRQALRGMVRDKSSTSLYEYGGPEHGQEESIDSAVEAAKSMDEQ
jgi:hypothetical protein